ncbi:MAG: hypothetical protein ABWX96_06880 [Propionibacteriaceae bacterium]
MNAWERQRALARTTNLWAAASIAVGAPLAARAEPWWRAFGQQHLGWGVVDLGIVAVLNTVQARRMSGLANPLAPAALAREQRRLHRVLLINVAADAGYLIGGLVMWRRRSQPRVSGAGAAIALQGAFLLAHDAYHAWGSAD